jgi:hypothetical protein
MEEIEMTGLLFKLADMGITGIKVHYEGSGDSGCIENIGYTTEPCETPDDVDEKVETGWGSDYNLAYLDNKAYKAIEDFATEKLLQDIEDWYNNEGGFGDICICVPSGKYTIDNHVRYYQTEDYQHEGSLIEKSAD